MKWHLAMSRSASRLQLVVIPSVRVWLSLQICTCSIHVFHDESPPFHVSHKFRLCARGQEYGVPTYLIDERVQTPAPK